MPHSTPSKSLRAYCGEYLISPFGLHLGFNACSHACWYCFANLNAPDRRFSLSSVKAALNDRSSSLPAWLIANRFGVLMSNDSDPLAASNLDQFLVVADLLDQHGIHWSVQTKGGPDHGQRRILEGPPRVIYVSLTSDDDDLLRQMEPGAPAFAARLDLLRAAVDAGHFVIAGINPLVPGWWDDPLAIADHLHDCGVTRAWTGDLHLNNDQIRNLPPRHRDHYALEITLARGQSAMAGKAEAVAALERAGIICYEGDSLHHDFWSGLEHLDFRPMPLADRFFAMVREQAEGQPIIVHFSVFDRWCRTSDFPRKSILKEYAKMFRREVYQEVGRELNVRSMTEINALFWDVHRFNRSPLCCRYWYLPIREGTALIDDAGYKIFIYNPNQSISGSVLWDLDQRPVFMHLE